MTDELRRAAEALKVAADKLAAAVEAGEADNIPETDRPPGWYIARVVPGHEDAVEPLAVKTRHGVMTLVKLPADKDEDYELTEDGGYVSAGCVEVICSVDDALEAWQVVHNADNAGLIAVDCPIDETRVFTSRRQDA